MTEKELTTLLQKHKDAPELGGGFDFESSWNRLSQDLDFEEVPRAHYGFRDYVEYAVWQFAHVLWKPAAIGVATIGLVFTGWVSLINASLGTLPGDQLYSVKLSMERAQLALATTDEQRAQLKIDFTNRRLQEMVELSASLDPNRDARVQLAVRQLRNEVQTIKTNLQEVPTSELATQVGRHADTYRQTVSTSANQLSADVQDEIEEVKDIIEETKEQAVEVILTTAEDQQDAQAIAELERTFAQQRDQLLARASGLSEEKQAALEEAIGQAEQLMDSGLHRRAFQLLREWEVAVEASN